MTALADGELPGGIDLGHGIAVAHGDLGQRAEAVQRRDMLGGFLNAADLGGDAVAHLTEEVVFQGLDPIPGGEKAVFQLLQLGGEVALV